MASTTPSWSWPSDMDRPEPLHQRRSVPGNFCKIEEEFAGSTVPRQASADSHLPDDVEPEAEPALRSSRTWPPRTCRICLETVQPTYVPPTDSVTGLFQSHPGVIYESEDPASGRLIRPCKCKGSSRYVHESCLQQWRHTDKDFGRRHYWECPTCGFKYRLRRLTWGRYINNAFTQILMTVAIFFLAMFVLGFVADPIINLYLDPYYTLSSVSSGKRLEPILSDDDDGSDWFVHFLKGLASLGLLGFAKIILVSPWHYWQLRHSGLMGNRAAAASSGRDRLANLSWVVIVLGIGTFLWGVYKGVRAFSRRTLVRASEKVMDVPLDDDEIEYEETKNTVSTPVK